MRTKIQDIVQNYIYYRNNTANHNHEDLRQNLKRFHFSKESMERMITLCYEEWEKYDTVRSKINLAKTNAVLGISLFIPIAFIVFRMSEIETSPTRFRIIMFVGIVASFMIGVKGIIDQKKFKRELSKIKENWSNISEALIPLAGQQIQDLVLPNENHSVPVLKTNKGSYEIFETGLFLTKNKLSGTSTKLKLKGKIIQRVVLDEVSLNFELDSDEYLVYSGEWEPQGTELFNFQFSLITKEEFRIKHEYSWFEKFIQYPDV